MFPVSFSNHISFSFWKFNHNVLIILIGYRSTAVILRIKLDVKLE